MWGFDEGNRGVWRRHRVEGSGFDDCAGADQGFDDGRIVDVGIVVEGGPQYVIEHGSSPDVFDLQGRLPVEERFYGVEVAGKGGYVKAGLSVLVLGAEIRTFVHEELDDAGAAEIAGPHEGGLDLLLREAAFG